MNDNDQLDDGAVLRAVRGAVSQLPLAMTPGPQVITARGRARRRRRAGLSVALVRLETPPSGHCPQIALRPQTQISRNAVVVLELLASAGVQAGYAKRTA